MFSQLCFIVLPYVCVSKLASVKKLYAQSSSLLHVHVTSIKLCYDNLWLVLFLCISSQHLWEEGNSTKTWRDTENVASSWFSFDIEQIAYISVFVLWIIALWSSQLLWKQGGCSGRHGISVPPVPSRQVCRAGCRRHSADCLLYVSHVPLCCWSATKQLSIWKVPILQWGTT